MQYSRFVRRGYDILESSLPELALVAGSPPGDAPQRFVVVVTNPLPREEARRSGAMPARPFICPYQRHARHPP